MQSKTGTEFFSVAADGKIYWWDTKKLNEPVDKFILDLDKKDAIGITKLEYDSSIGRNKTIFIFI
jgi:dynein intermediate chain 2